MEACCTKAKTLSDRYVRMVSMGYRIGFRGCAHLGYASRRIAKHPTSGWDLRVVDGHVAHQLIMHDMLDCGVAGIVDGGDLFHWSRPRIRDIECALTVDDMRVENGAWLLVNTGNHDASHGSDVSATSVLHRPTLNARSVYPDPMALAADHIEQHAQTWPGFYEIHQPNPDVPLYLHLIPHHGLDPELAEFGITIDPHPVPDAVNVLSTHGIFMADERLYRAVERHGAERIIPTDWANRGWDAVILSDYHTQGPIPGYGEDDGRGRGQVWYTGSALCRGFSDDPGPRGWLLVELHEDGTVSVTPRHVWQRPQRDLEPVNATGKTVNEINDEVQQRLSSQRWWDEGSAELTGHGGWIVRLKITGTSREQRHGLESRRGEWDQLMSEAASWHISMDTAPGTVSVDLAGGEHRSITARITDFPEALTSRIDQGELSTVKSGMPTEIVSGAMNRAVAILRDEDDSDPRRSATTTPS